MHTLGYRYCGGRPTTILHIRVGRRANIEEHVIQDTISNTLESGWLCEPLQSNLGILDFQRPLTYFRHLVLPRLGVYLLHCTFSIYMR